LKDNESNSTKEQESRRRSSYSSIEDISLGKKATKRYTPPDFHSKFSLFITDDDPRTIREEVDSEDGKLWKKDMVEEMEALDKNDVTPCFPQSVKITILAKNYGKLKDVNV
jgi:hypothetical protein